MSNTIVITGNVTRDPELRFTPSGQAMCRFAVADNRRWQNKTTKEWEERVSFVDCVVWGEQAEHASESVAKGDRVLVSGRIEQNNWETDAGEKRSKLELVVDEIGPSLRWAVAQVTRIKRESSTGNGHAPVPQPAPVGGYAYDEEPF